MGCWILVGVIYFILVALILLFNYGAHRGDGDR